jgi:predicted rRNA methylase
MRERERRPVVRGHQDKQEQDQYIIEGLSVLKEYLRFRKEAIIKVYCKQKYAETLIPLLEGTGLTPVITDAQAQRDERPRNPTIQKPSRPESRSQPLSFAPVWAEIKVDYLSEAAFFKRIRAAASSRRLIIAIDHITDPQNLGSIARSAAFFGITEIIVPKTRQVHITKGALSSAQGAFALSDMVMVTNLVRLLEQLKEEGYWIVSADMDGEPFQKVAGFYEKTVLVLGSEDKGVSHLVKNKSDRIVAIKGSEGSLESLNVGVAAGILINSFAAQA